MKFVILTVAVLSTILAANASPVSISGNNVGDIVTVGVSANAVLSSNVELNIITALLALINQQAAVIVPSNEQPPQEFPAVTDLSSMITPELLSNIKNIKITPEMIEGVKKLLNENSQ